MKSLIGAAILMVCAVLTYQRSQAWQSHESIWEEAVKESPLLPRPHLNLSGAYEEKGQYEKALAEELEALQLSSDGRRMARHQSMTKMDAMVNIALLYLLKGEFRKSEELNSEILEDIPDDKTALINRAAARMALHDCPEAFLDYLKAGFQELPKCQ
jgi:tetratricopeptide (TPR) repeat protein